MGFLFGEPKIEGEKRQQCLSYLEEQWKINSFQKKESDLYDDSVMKFSNSGVTDNHVVKEMYRAANRLVQSVNESLRRLREISFVPDVASTAWHAWELRYSDYLAWATVQAAVADALLSNRANADAQLERLSKLTLQRDKSLRKAIDETTKLMQGFKLTDNEHARLFQVAEYAQNENWQPEEPKEA
jgi:hypothetical protein